MPDTTLNSVVLPAPFGPITAKMSPGSDREADLVERGQPAERDAELVDREHAHADLRRSSAASDGTMPAGRKIMNTIMIRPSTMCS